MLVRCTKCKIELNESMKMSSSVYNCPNCGLEEVEPYDYELDDKTIMLEGVDEGITAKIDGDTLIIEGDREVQDFNSLYSNNTGRLVGVTKVLTRDGAYGLFEMLTKGLAKVFSTIGLKISGLTDIKFVKGDILDTGYWGNGITARLEGSTLYLEGSGSIRDFNPEDELHYINLQKIKSIIISEDIKKIGRYAFKSCATLQNIEAIGVVRVCEGAFLYSPELITCKLPKVETIERIAFFGCKKLRDVKIHNVEHIEDSAFMGCICLTEVELNHLLTLGTFAYSSCTSLRSFKATYLDSIRKSAFNGCTALEEVALPNLNKSHIDIFNGCSNLKMLVVAQYASYYADSFDYIDQNKVKVVKV